jgi:hypothetical protein
VTSTSAALGVALAGQAATAAPAGLATSVAGAATAGAAAGTLGAAGAILAMSKIKIGIVSAIVLAGLTTAVVELRANRALRAELQSNLAGDGEVERLQRENRQLTASVGKLEAGNPDVAELARLTRRISALKARPDGVADEELRAPHNVGRATATAAMETFCWAIDQKSLDLVVPFIRFSDDTPENRAAFMANFSAPVRARYDTPERLYAAALFGIGLPNPDPSVVMQIVNVREDRGPDEVDVRIWWQTASGKEQGGGSRMTRLADGWVLKPFPLEDEKSIALAKTRFDPTTGNLVPPPAEKH